jgi:hypothetical protein
MTCGSGVFVADWAATVAVSAGELGVRAKLTDVSKNSKTKAKIRFATCEVRFKCHRPEFAILTGSAACRQPLRGNEIKDRVVCLYLLLFGDIKNA